MQVLYGGGGDVKNRVLGSSTAKALPVQLQAVEVNQGEGGVLLIGPGVLEAEQQLGEAGLQTELGAGAGLDVVEEVRGLAPPGQGAEAYVTLPHPHCNLLVPNLDDLAHDGARVVQVNLGPVPWRLPDDGVFPRQNDRIDLLLFHNFLHRNVPGSRDFHKTVGSFPLRREELSGRSLR